MKRHDRQNSVRGAIRIDDEYFLTDSESNQSLLAKEPSWMGLTASYLRNYKRYEDEMTTGLMPHHEHLVEAVRGLYRDADETDKAVMDGSFQGERKEQKYRFFRLSCLLAIRAGLCGGCVVPPEWEKLEKMEGDETDDELS